MLSSPSSSTREQVLTNRVRRALDELRTCSPVTLRQLSSDLVVRGCNTCDQELTCDACDARSALQTLLNALASVTDGEV
jgi:hypothetical protein